MNDIRISKLEIDVDSVLLIESYLTANFGKLVKYESETDDSGLSGTITLFDISPMLLAYVRRFVIDNGLQEIANKDYILSIKVVNKLEKEFENEITKNIN
jgi:hypothetical protein